MLRYAVRAGEPDSGEFARRCGERLPAECGDLGAVRVGMSALRKRIRARMPLLRSQYPCEGVWSVRHDGADSRRVVTLSRVDRCSLCKWKFELCSRMPTPNEADELELPAGEPVMILKRTTFTAENRPVEFARGVHAASRFAWSYSFKIPD